MTKIVISKGDQYGKLTVIRELPKVKTPTTQYRLFECQCECGNIVTISMNALRTNKKESKCPECKKKPIKPGDRFNRLVVLQEIEPRVRVFKGKSNKTEGADRKETYRRFSCLCDCGEVCIKEIGAFARNVVSCGCLAGEVNSVNNRTHGMKKAPEYKIWLGIKQRCYNPNDANYHNYGQRGIRVSDEWLESFEVFYQDMGKRPEGRYSIERLGVNGDYCKENCVWATAYEQNRNRRNNHFVTYKGETLCLVDWAEKLGISRNRFSPMFTGSISGYNKMTDEEIIAHLVEHGDTLGRKLT